MDNTHINNQGTEMNVYQKLNEAREKFHASALKKSGVNSFAKYNYFELGDFIIPALQIFKEFGLTSVIRFGTDQAVMEIVNNEKPEEKILVTSPMSTAALKGCHEVQNLGAVQTYIRRYLWVAALEIVEHDALDSSEPLKPEAKTTPKPEPVPTISAEQAADIEALISEVKADKKGLLEWVSQNTNTKVTKVSEIPNIAHVHVVRMLEKKKVQS